MKGYVLLLLWLGLWPVSGWAQMDDDGTVRYGNEWINAEQPYQRFAVTEAGMYRLATSALVQAGWPNTLATGQYRLYRHGQEVPLYITNGQLYFYAYGNDGALDRFLYTDPTQQLNPAYSIISDTAYYYLTYAATDSGLRYADAGSTPAPTQTAPYWWRETQTIFSEQALKEYTRNQGNTIYYSHFTPAEGFGSRSDVQLLQAGGTEQSVNLPLPQLLDGGPATQVSTRFGTGIGPHQQRISANGQPLWTEDYTGWQVREVTVPVAGLTNETLTLDYSGTADDKDEVSIAYVRARYPATLTANGAAMVAFVAEATAETVSYTISDFPAAAAAVVYDITNAVRYPVTVSGGTASFVLPPAGELRQLYLLSETAPIPVGLLTGVAFPNLLQEDTDYLIITHAALRSGGNDPVAAYAAYRATAQGGQHQVQVVNIGDLYEQFAYGQTYHPLAIRNFVAYLQKEGVPLGHCFLIGKGREYRDVRTPAQVADAQGTFYLPSFGYPASDNLLLSPLGSSRPRVPVGRLPAVSPAEVSLYLDKVKSQETSLANAQQTIADRDWRKHILHLGGGGSPNEQAYIRANLEQMANVIENNDFAGQVTAFYKTSTDPLETSQSEQIFARINKGVSIISFFGHSSAGTFDFNIDNPDNYDNAGKFPLILSLGCYSGNMFEGFRSIGERFVFQENRAALAYGASLGLGYINALSPFANKFYQLAGEDMYGASIGQLFQATIQNFDAAGWIGTKILTEQFLLNGDPALTLNPAPGPDFVTDLTTIQLDPAVLTPQRDSFDLTFDIVNLGRAAADSFTVRLEQELPGGQRQVWANERVQVPGYKATIQLRLPSPDRAAVGENRLHLTLDTDNDIIELPAPAAEANNKLTDATGREGLAFFVVDNTAIPIFPTEFALVSSPPELRAATADALIAEQTYLLQLDTTPYFTNPLALTTRTQRGGILRWTPTINWQADRVYYWRSSPDSLPGSPGFVWQTSSFTYQPGTDPGWGQSHWGQYERNDLQNMEAARFRKLSFVENIRDFRIKQKIYDPGDLPGGFVNNTRWSDFFRWNILESMQIVVIDTLGQFIRNPKPGLYGSVNTSTNVAITCFSFPISTTEERGKIIDFLENIIEEKQIVIVYPAIRTANTTLYVDEWAADSMSLGGKNLFNVLEQHGATQIRDLQTGMRPYLFAYRNTVGPIDEVLSTTITDVFNWEYQIETFWDRGAMTSRLVGPAVSWDRLVWSGDTLNLGDTLQIGLTAIREDGGENRLAEDLGHSGTYDLTQLSATEYPYLRLDLRAVDETELTSPRLNYWRAYYQGRPDLALDASTTYAFHADTLQQGELATLRIAVANVGNYSMDTTSLTARLVDASQREIRQTIPIAALSVGDTIVVDLALATRELSGDAQLSLLLNASDSPVEQYRFNNQAVRTLYVTGDRRQPTLHVTFDGIPIRNGDLVAVRPAVTIELVDENQYLPLTDTSLFLVNVSDPDGNTRRVYLDGSEALFIPAEPSTRNRARIEWNPEFLSDGTYQLTVRGRDVSGNNSGALAYQVAFEVITERRLGDVLPYPNPFTTQTRFVYTLTGDETPTEMKIQIMTVSGRIVREITQAELGPLRVGTHQTDFVWDGTDQFGDRLANGVYLYRVVAFDSNGEAFKYHDTGTSAYFKNKIGKIVIFR